MLDLNDVKCLVSETPRQIKIKQELEVSIQDLVHKLFEDLATLNWIQDDPIKGSSIKKKNKKLKKHLKNT